MRITFKLETLNPKLEINPKLETGNLKFYFGFRISDLFRISGLGFRV